jgi:hypothetical protein
MSAVGFQAGKDAGHHIKPSPQLKGRSSNDHQYQYGVVHSGSYPRQ